MKICLLRQFETSSPQSIYRNFLKGIGKIAYYFEMKAILYFYLISNLNYLFNFFFHAPDPSE